MPVEILNTEPMPRLLQPQTLAILSQVGREMESWIQTFQIPS